MISLKQKKKGPPGIRGQGKEGSIASRRGVHSWGMDIRKNGQLYLFLIPSVVSVFLFNYLPMYGVQIAFKDFRPAAGIWGSRWVGWKWFERFFNSYRGCKIFCVYGNETFQIRIRYVVVFVGFCSRIFCRIYLSGYSISCPLSFIHAF